MKTIFQYLLLTAACAALGACQDFSDDTAFTPETPELSFVETSITAEKATKDYELSIKSNLPWRIECDKDWVSFDPSYGQGDATITVTVAANRTLDERTATISAYVIKGENVTLPVTQAAASASDLATHYYVKTDGSADKDGLTWETATTLANAIDQAMNGDVIHVAAGSYVPSVPLTGMKTALDNTREYLESYLSASGFTGDELNAAGAINYWWGFASGAVDVQLAPSVPDGPRELLRVLREALVHGELTPFHRRIADQAGTLRNDGEQWFSPETILRMDWLCSNVTGKIPDYEELLPMAQPMVRLLGVYRDALQPKKRGPLL